MPLSTRLRPLLVSVLLLLPLLTSSALAQALPAGAIDVAELAAKDLAVPEYAIEGLELADLLLVSAYQRRKSRENGRIAAEAAA
jgi:hypothetical protein